MPFGVNDTTRLAQAGDAAATCARAEDKAKPANESAPTLIAYTFDERLRQWGF